MVDNYLNDEKPNAENGQDNLIAKENRSINQSINQSISQSYFPSIIFIDSFAQNQSYFYGKVFKIQIKICCFSTVFTTKFPFSFYFQSSVKVNCNLH